MFKEGFLVKDLSSRRRGSKLTLHMPYVFLTVFLCRYFIVSDAIVNVIFFLSYCIG